MKTQHTVRTIPELIDAISAGSNDPTEKGPEVVLIMLESTGQIVAGTYSQETPQAICLEDTLLDDDALRPLVYALVVQSTPFVTQTGSDDTVCTLKWTITTKKP